jgi:preprotein translocase subunit SecE
MFERFVRFLREVRLEASKVTWPTIQELRSSTIVVVVAVAIISVFIAVVDRVLAQAVTMIL